MFEIDKRMLYILPAVLALAISITTFFFEFGYHFIDMRNMCYTIFIDAPDNCTTEEFLDTIQETLVQNDVHGFTVVKNEIGGYRNGDNNLVMSDSYQIILMDTPKDIVGNLARKLQTKLNTEVMIKTAKADITYLFPDNI